MVGLLLRPASAEQRLDALHTADTPPDEAGERFVELARTAWRAANAKEKRTLAKLMKGRSDNAAHLAQKSGVLLARVQHSQDINHVIADLIHHDVIWMDNVLTRSGYTTGPEQIWHLWKVLGRLDDGCKKALRCQRVALVYVINDFHQIGGCLVRPADGLHGLCGALQAWHEPWPSQHRAASVAFRCAGLPQPWRETIGCNWFPVLRCRTRKRWGIGRRSQGKD